MRYLFFVILILVITLMTSCSKNEPSPIAPAVQEPTPDVTKTGTITVDLVHKNRSRSYILYVPENYDGSTAVPLVFNFHGYTSNATEQMIYGDFREVSDHEGFIIAHPQGLDFNGNPHWNVGGWTIGSTADDIGFTEEMITKISEDYNIDANRIYSTGMSNGGYFSFVLACEMSDKIAAIASVTGSMTPETYNECDPERSVPIMQFHGTLDDVVPYGGAAWSRGIDDVLDYWVAENKLDDTPTVMEVEDIITNDNSNVELIQYGEEGSGSPVIHYKITGGGHTWPGTSISSPRTNYDINASEVIWEFFDSFDLEGRR